jgi:hypothetical protein
MTPGRYNSCLDEGRRPGRRAGVARVLLEARVSSPLRLAKEARKHGMKQLPAAVFWTAEAFPLPSVSAAENGTRPLLALDSDIVVNSDAL